MVDPVAVLKLSSYLRAAIERRLALHQSICMLQHMSGKRGFPSRPNQSLQPTATAVTPRAGARVAPAAAVAEH